MSAESDTATLRRYVDLAMQLLIMAIIGIAGVTLFHFAGQGATAPPPQPAQFETTLIDWVGGLLIVAGMVVVAVATTLRRRGEGSD